MNRNRLAFFMAVIGALLLGFLLLSNVRAQEGTESPVIEHRYEDWHQPQFIPHRATDMPELQRSPDQQQAPAQGAADFTVVVYQSIVGDSWDVYKLEKLAGGTPRPLVEGASQDFLPRLNVQKDRVVFVSDRTGNPDIYTIGFDGSDLRRLTYSQAIDSLPTWSPDGKRIAFVSDRDGNPEIYLVNVDGSNLQRLTTSNATDLDPSFSPDGKKIAWIEVVSDTDSRVKLMDVDGSGKQVIIGPQAYIRTLAWSPDGDAIAMELDWDDNGWLDVGVFYFDDLGNPFIHFGQLLMDHTMGSWISTTRLMTGTIYYELNYGNLYVRATSFVENSSDFSGYSEFSYPLAFYPWGEGDIQRPYTRVKRLPLFTRLPAPGISWWATDRGPAGINGYLFSYLVGDYEYQNDIWLNEYTYQLAASAFPDCTRAGATCYFRVNAWDNAGNQSNPGIESWDTFTTYYNHDLFSTVYDQRGYPLAGVQFDAGGSELIQPPTGQHGFAHGRYIADQADITILDANGITPRQSVGIYLPNVSSFNWLFGPKENLLANGDFQEGKLEPAWVTAGPADPAVQLTSPDSGTISYVSKLGQVTISVEEEEIHLPHYYGGDGTLIRESGGTLHAVWGDNIAFPDDPQVDRFNLFHSFRALGDTWSIPLVLNPESAYQVYAHPRMIFDSAGTLHVIWIEVMPGSSRVQTRQQAPDGTWSVIETVFSSTVSDALYQIKAVMDSSNALHVVFLFRDELFYTTRPAGGSWTAPVALTDAYTVNSFDIAVDQADGVHVIYYHSPGLLQHRGKPAGSSWGVLETLLSDAELNHALELVIDSSNRWHLLYSKLSSYYDGRVYYWQRSADGAWRAPVRLDDLGTEISVSNLNLIIRPDGALLASWEKLSETHMRVWDRGIWTAEMNTPEMIDPNSAISDGDKGIYTFQNVESSQYLMHFPIPENASGSIAQMVTLPADLHAPTLALNLRGEVYRNGGIFEILINDTPVYSTTSASESWESHWFDLTPWLGQQVTVTLQVENPSLTDAIVVAVDNISLGAWTTQVVEEIEPAALPPNTQGQVLTLRGENFYGTPEVWLGAQPLANVQVVDEHTLRAEVPVRLPPGRYDLKVFQSGELQNPVLNMVLVGTELFLPLGLR